MTIVWDDDVTQLDAAHMNQLEQITRKGVPDGYASLGADGLVPPTQLPAIPPLVITDADIPASITRDTELAAGLATKADTTAMVAADLLKVDKDSVVTAAVRLVASKLLAGDAQPAFRILGDGKIEWGDGGATAPDTSLYHYGNSLRTSGGFFADLGLTVRQGGAGQLDIGPSSTTPSILFGGDTSLYRSVAGRLQSDTEFFSGGRLVAKNATADQIVVGGGSASIAFGLAQDTNLYRFQAGVLATDGQSIVKSHGSFNWNTVNEVHLGHNGVAVAPAIYFGNAADTNLYRDQATVLRTAGQLWANSFLAANKGTANEVTVGHKGDVAAAGFYFGNAGDTNLYRSAAGELTTSGKLIAGLLQASGGATRVEAGNIYDGTKACVVWGGDVNLYRFGAGYLKSDANVLMGATVAVDHNNVGGKLYFGSGTDASLYRAAANTLETPGTLNVGGLAITVPGVGGRIVEFGGPDSGGAGYRMMRVTN